MQPFANVQKFVSMLMVCINMISQTGTILVMIFHIYALIGMTMYNTKLNDYYPTVFYETSISDFNSYDRALVVMLQTITENGWSNILVDYAVKFDSLFRAAAFFHSFYHLGKFIILSLLTGLIWEIFSIVSARMEARDLQEAAQAEQDSLNSKKASLALQELDGNSYCSENLNLDAHTLVFGQDEALVTFRKKLKQAKKEDDVVEVEMVRDDYSFDDHQPTKAKTPLLPPSRGSRRAANPKEHEFGSHQVGGKSRKSITRDDLMIPLGSNHERRASMGYGSKRAHSMDVKDQTHPDRWMKPQEPQSQPLSVFFKKRLKKRVSEAKQFIQILSGFDIDIFLNFAPDRCLFRENFMRIQVKERQPEKASEPEAAPAPEKKEETFNEDALLGKIFISADSGTIKLENPPFKVTQKEMTEAEIQAVFIMQGVLLNTFVKAAKIESVTREAFIGALLRFSDNFNQHMLISGGFFSLIYATTDNQYFYFTFQEEEGKFIRQPIEGNALLELISDPSIENDVQYVVKDLFDCEGEQDAEGAISCYKSLLKMSKSSNYSKFKYQKPDNAIW